MADRTQGMQELKVGGPAICMFIFNKYWVVAYWLGTILVT